MAEEEIETYGKGIALVEANQDDKTRDIEISGDGDIAITRGVEELEKDISFKLARALQDSQGQRITANFLSRVEELTRRILNGDERIRSVGSVEAFQSDVDGDKYYVEATAIAERGETVTFEATP